MLGLIFLLDVPVGLLLAFFMWWAVTDNAPDIPPGCSFMNPCPSTPGEYTRSLVFCLGSILLWVVFVYAIYRLLLACLDARESAGSRCTAIAVTSALIVGLSAVVRAYCLIGSMVAHWFRNSFGVSGGSNATRTFSRHFSPRSIPRTSRCVPATADMPTHVRRRPSVRQIADHVTLLFCDVCKTEAEAQ